MKKRFCAFILVLCCICSQAGIVTFAQEIGKQTNNEITGQWSGGDFHWSYNPDTYTLKVTGEGTWRYGNIFYMVNYRVDKVIFENCIFSGSLSGLLSKNLNLRFVEFVNCDTSNVTDMSSMFYKCSFLENIGKCSIAST